MKNRTKKVIFIAAFFMILWMAFSPTANAQTPTPPTRDILILEIQQRAQKDVELGATPQSPSDLAVLFSEQAATVGMTMSEVKDIYDEAYQAAKPAKSPWDDLLKPQGGWIFLIVGGLLVILANIAKDYLTTLFKKLAEAAYQRLARFRPFWMIALRRYRQSLENTYRELKIPFRAGRPLEMKDVYVPVRVDGGDKKQVDAYQTIQNQKRLVVLGDPGSGKTMFLRHVAFTYARQGLDDFDGQPIPVYLELNRVESAGGDLLAALTKTLENHNFPGAEGFLKLALENHALLILLDGLDEVNAAARPALVNQIRDFDQKHPANRIIVTCRKAVYQGELDAWVDGKLEIVEFSDQQIQRFMTSWQKDMPAEKSIEHFFRTLQERPQIMALARNPLLLTMVAYLYVDTEFALPHSRSEFYSRSTDLLLDQWKLERNRYKATHKRIVLQRLALVNQSQAGKTGERRTLELADVLKEIRAVLPDLTLKTEDAQPLLDEILQRSGLMLAIDGGTRYQFTHLTLQEYFAARALEADGKGLLDFYRATPDAWREVVRLWCALEHDSTAMLKELYAFDPVMTFECLSDAQQVDNAYADELIESFKSSLSDEVESASLSSTFAMLAADPRPRGKKWFEFIKSNLDIKQNRLAACAVLAQTNIPQAAEPLVKLAATDSSVIPFLVQLGNLAVPALTEPAQKGEIWAMDALVDIGTPQAALVLEPLLWTDEPKAYHAAWRLAALLSLSGVEDALQTVTLTSVQRKAKQIEWVWKPFSENTTLRIITGRIAYLLHTTRKNTLPTIVNHYDPRLVIPLCTLIRGSLLKEIDSKDFKILLMDNIEKEGEQQASSENISKRKKRAVNLKLAKKNSTDPIWQHLYFSLSSAQQVALLKTLLCKPSLKDWLNIFRPLDYIFETSWHNKILIAFPNILVFLSLWGIKDEVYSSPTIMNWTNILLIILGVVLFLLTLSANIVKLGIDMWKSFAVCLLLGLGTVTGALVQEFTLLNLVTRLFIGISVGSLAGLLAHMAGLIIDTPLEHVFGKNSFLRIWRLEHKAIIGAFCGVIGCFLSGAPGVGLLIAIGGAGAPLLTILLMFDFFETSKDIKIYLVGQTLTGLSIGAYVGGVTLALGYFSTVLLNNLISMRLTFLFWFIWSSIFAALYVIIIRLNRRAKNPFQGLLEASLSANRVTNKRMTMVGRLLRWMRL